ncbi:O-antigen ligase family protein [Sphingomonas lutea]|uniref:O-antigen ligase family protein n=1 Tax=Sphingomonas lutea TaxID=1045317 RepID=A0A7G9SG55_9SPHN|nr:O-antigen ligase family protein [Sphingomonas lutea]QNN66830.1 O-antigen ligase family protein [Sphingomonas lutea]
MADRMRHGVAPLYLLMCLTLGGSAQGIWTNVLLQLTGVAIIAWSALAPPSEPLTGKARALAWLALAALIVVVLQLIPLPAAIWSGLGGRAGLAADFRILGQPLPAMSLSLTPHDTIATVLRAIPAVAMYCAVVRLRAYRGTWLALALILATLAAILLGVLQVAGGEDGTSSWYFYPQSSFGLAVGFFANANHMGQLLVVSLPFIAALFVAARGRKTQQRAGIAAVLVGVALVVAVGIALNRSAAALILAVPAAGASLMLLPRARNMVRGWAVPVLALLAVAAGAVALGPVGDRMLGSSVSVSARAEMARTTIAAAREFLPFGSGLGTFRPVYRYYEDPDTTDRVATNHAHNDYLELALELGLPGILLIVAFLGWWALTAGGVWRSAASSPFARAAAIASAAILLHSLVDYPLRTAALGAVFAMCLGLMTVALRKREDATALRPTRHMGIG